MSDFISEEEVDKALKSNLHFADNFFKLALIGEKLFKTGIKFKNPTFYEEREVRIVHGYPGLAAERDMFKHKFTNDNIISYIEIPIDHKEQFPVLNKIVIGPKSKASIADVRNFIESNFYCHIDLEYSKSNSSLL